MALEPIGAVNALYPSLTVIVGARVRGKANWMTVAHLGVMNHAMGAFPQYLGISAHPSHYTNIGIREHGEFSINIPSRAMMELTDYVGIVSGKNTDKSDLFPMMEGDLPNAPMIATCPVAMQCRVAQKVIVGEHELFIGELVATYVQPEVFKDGKIDLTLVDPILFDFRQMAYHALGERIGKPWNAGKAIKQSRTEKPRPA